MPIIATPEVGIPLPFDVKPEEIDDFREKAYAMFKTVEALAGHGLSVDVTDQDKQEARLAFAASAAPVPVRATPGTIVHLESILNDWDQEVLDVSRRLRNYVTNKLIVETTDPDPKVRLKSLEMLGKVSNVGLFSERVDITVTHRTIHDIESDLKKTLELFTGQVVDVTAKEVPRAVADINLDEEFGEVSAKLVSSEPSEEPVRDFDES